MVEGVFCCPTRLQRPLDRDQESETEPKRRREEAEQRTSEDETDAEFCPRERQTENKIRFQTRTHAAGR